MIIALGLLGLCLGSFAGAMVWRLRARQLAEDEVAGEPVDALEVKSLQRLNGTLTTHDRSLCLNCGHRLKWYDLIPLVSWLSTAGRCRYCKRFIGWFEPAIELGTAALFVASYLLWPEPLQAPMAIMQFILWLIIAVGFVILFVYDLKWFILPDRVVFPLMVVAGCMAILNVLSTSELDYALLSLGGSLLILAGLYWVIYLVSKGRAVGFGDVKLGVVLALVLADYQLAFIALLAANLLGCLLVLPGMLMGKIKRSSHVPFGPLLIAGTCIALFAGSWIMIWYMSTFL